MICLTFDKPSPKLLTNQAFRNCHNIIVPCSAITGYTLWGLSATNTLPREGYYIIQPKLALSGKKRRTGIIASSAAAARAKCRRGCGRLYKVRQLTASEEKTAHAGGWVRGTASGKSAGGDRHISGFGPKLKRADDSTPAKRIIDWNGFKIGLQYLPFELRHGKILPAAYGHIRGTRGADGMAIDVYVGVELDCPDVYAIRQVINGEFDEEKFVIGVRSMDEAKALYLKVMPEEFFGGISKVSTEVWK